MEESDRYLTVTSHSNGDYRERGSKFLSLLFPCRSDEDLKAEIASLKKQHPTSKHFCYASVIGTTNPQNRLNDDGEPSGTAGLPILNQILSAGLCNAAIVVVRHFGGTKLGKAGLIRAYKESAQDAISNAQVVEKLITRSVQVFFSYDDSGSVMKAVERFPEAKIIDQSFELKCAITYSVPKSSLANALHLFDHLPQVKSVELL